MDASLESRRSAFYLIGQADSFGRFGEERLLIDRILIAGMDWNQGKLPI